MKTKSVSDVAKQDSVDHLSTAVVEDTTAVTKSTSGVFNSFTAKDDNNDNYVKKDQLDLESTNEAIFTPASLDAICIEGVQSTETTSKVENAEKISTVHYGYRDIL
eukprot:Awhi_evm1s495